ncbi:hypothetical protein FEM48_Zijuj01G0199500 [Ziziphus jujuba var. spinosa]|uniref:GOLD domain-containing protein n=1 Tax=Ziziphus jujuba var. spinosa TaxID=714518 RepID=A0A978W391_ZIZJJ|nr:hypothetical protein FEM48_Zijuj01G0199500 [Ziziphus jujuba var. spinosa]
MKTRTGAQWSEHHSPGQWTLAFYPKLIEGWSLSLVSSAGISGQINPNEGHPLPDSHKLTLRVTSQYGNTLHSADHQDSGQFSFAAAEAGSYMTCFFAPDHKPETSLTVDFDWRTGVSAQDWSNVAKKGSVELMELGLKKMLDTVTTIHGEMFHLHLKEEEMQELNKSTSTKMTVFTLLSIVICLLVAGMQLWHLKTFFEKKKLI